MSRARDLAQGGTLVLVVLHDLSLAARWADEILVMTEGALYAQGTPEEVITRSMLRDVYGVDGHAERNAAGQFTVHLNAAIM